MPFADKNMPFAAGKLRVFLVDDLPLGLRLMERSLQFADESDFEVVGTASNGCEALNRIPAAAPQLLVTDLDMPGMDGIELARRIHDSFPDIRVLVTSDAHQTETARRAAQVGAFEYCHKSCLVGALARAFESLQAGRPRNHKATPLGRSNWAEQLFGGLLFSSAAGLAICDRSFRYEFINPALAAMNGLSPREHINKTVREVLGDFADILEPKFREVFSTGIPLLSVEMAAAALPSRNGPGKWIEDYFPITDSKGDVTHIAIVVVEATRFGDNCQNGNPSALASSLRYPSDDPIRIFRSWKEIASYSNTSVRTAQRWEQDFELPVRRLRTQRGVEVMAFKSEMDRWLASAAHLRVSAISNDQIPAAFGPAAIGRPQVESSNLATQILRTWKEIARYLAASVRAVQRWERDLELPVRRIKMKAGLAVIAFKPDLDDWLRSRLPSQTYPRNTH